MRSTASSLSGDVAESQMEKYYIVLATDENLEELADHIRSDSGLVEAAYVKPVPTEPMALAENEDDTINEMLPTYGDSPPATPDYTASQNYLNPAPAGIDARYAWAVQGGRGAEVKIIDCEWGWNFSHEDLLQKQMGVVFGGNSSNNNHGTAVLGEISADVNTFGVAGICPDAIVCASSFVNSPSSARTIREAADRASPGDFILLEIHRGGPNATGAGQFGYIAVEWWPDDFAAIRYAVKKRG